MAQSEYVRCLDKEDKVSYFDKLKQLGFYKVEDDPFIEEEQRSKGHLKKWSTLIDSWPTVEFGDIYVYLIDCPGYTPKSLKAYKSLDAYNAFVNGWVHQLNIRQSHTGHCIIRASVNRSQNISDGQHKAWVGFKIEDGSIISGHCTCMNGSATTCVHAVAIMFQVEAAPRLGDTGKICTVCHCTKEEVPEPQENLSSKTTEDESVHEDYKTDDVKSQEEFDITILPETSVSTGKTEIHCGGNDTEELTYIQCEGVEPGMIILLSTEGPDGQTVISQQLDEVHSCKVCNLGFATGPLLESHMETHNEQVEMKPTQDAEIVSNVAQQESSTNSDKTIKAGPGKKTSAQKGKYQCNVCNSAFATNLRLENHKKSQHKEEDLKLRDEAEDTTVIETENNPKEEPLEGSKDNVYSCVMCELTFTTSFLLESHMEKDHNAEIVEVYEMRLEEKGTYSLSSFLSKSQIPHDSKRHHTPKEKPFKCQECGQNFEHRGSLFIHVRAHSKKNKSFQVSCHQCGMRFKDIPDFQAHLREHSLEKRFACSECDKKFSLQSKLKQHKRVHAGERPFQCNDCGKSFTQSSTYRRHMEIHTAAKSFVCDVCGKAFSVSEYLRRHMITHDDEKPFKCKECGKAFFQHQGLRKHIDRNHTGEKPFACSECDKMFALESKLKEHRRIHAGEKPFQCNDCGKSFTQRGTYRRHMEIHAAAKSYVCDVCGKAFNVSGYLRRHMATHNDENLYKYKCTICGRAFSQMSNCRRHMRIHSGEKPYICEICGHRFTQSTTLHAHMRTHTGEKPYECKVCSQRFATCTTLCLHKRTHTGKRPYKCNVCGKAFTQKSSLKRHMKRHVAGDIAVSTDIIDETDFIERTYECTICRKSFASSNYRKAHQKMHTGETPFKCSKCGKCFMTKIGLEYHQRTHTGDKPFECSVCARRFSVIGNLTRHMRTHTGEKPFECGTCGKAFGQSNSLNQHLRTHTGEKPYKCELCDKAFCENRGLKKHKQKIHTNAH